jgi:hypothetical protein
MDKIINIGVFKKSEEAEYYGKVIIKSIPNGYSCVYNLVSKKDKNNVFMGDFFVSNPKLAHILNYLDNRLNTLSESNKV